MVATKSRQSKSAKVTPPTFPFKSGDRIISRDGRRKGVIKKVGTQKVSFQWDGYDVIESHKIDFESYEIRLDTPQLSSVISRVPLNKIKTDGGTQPRAEINEQAVIEYAEDKKQGAEFPPVITFFDGQDYWLADGFHRFNADKLNEAEEIEAIVKQGDRRDAILYSVGANASHGLRRTNADKRRAVTRLLEDEEWVKLPDKRVSEIANVSREYVTRLRKELTEVGELSCDRSQDREVTRNGTTYTQNTSRIGGSSGSSSRGSTASSTASSDTNTDSNWFDELQYDDDGNCITLAEVTNNRYPELFGKHCQIKSAGNNIATLISPVDSKEHHYLVGEFVLTQPTAGRAKSTFDPHGDPSDRTDEHYTPEYIWKLALECLGVEQFDLDPCSNSHHSPNVPAKNLFTKEDNGLIQEWKGKVWFQPPYSNTKEWVVRLIGEYQAGNVEEAIALVKCDVSTQWFQPLFDFPICMVNHRIKFLNEDNNGGGAKFASAIVYLGKDIEKFYLTFDSRYSDSGIGTVVQAGVRGIHFGE